MIVVGAAFFDDDHSNQAVYVYRTSDGGATYDEIAKLTAAALAWDSGFGQSVAIDGDTIVVGTAYKATVYIFRIADGGVNEVTTLTPDVAWPENTFGRSVAIDGGTVVVGAWKDGPVSEGLAYVFLTSDGGTTYGQVAVLTAGDAAAGDHFGFSVEIDGDTVLVAAQQMPNGGPGAAYIFRTGDGDSYDQVTKLTAPDGAQDDRFSAFLAIEGSTVVIGAPRHDDAGTDSGAAYVFGTNDGWATYSFVAKLTADDAAAGDYFGKEVEIEDGVVAIGACAPPGIEPSGGEAVYIFHASDDGLTYSQVAKLTAADGVAGDRFGQSLAMDGGTIVVGAMRDEDAGNRTGSVYVFSPETPALESDSSHSTRRAGPLLALLVVAATTVL